MNIKNILLFLISSILLIACKAEIVELDIKAKDVFAAVDGEDGVIEFEAQFSNFGELDEEARAQVEALENILTKFMEIDDFEIENTDMGYDVILEGEMPISNKKLDATYYIHVSSSELFDGYIVFRTQGRAMTLIIFQIKCLQLTLCYHLMNFTQQK